MKPKTKDQNQKVPVIKIDVKTGTKDQSWKRFHFWAKHGKDQKAQGPFL